MDGRVAFSETAAPGTMVLGAVPFRSLRAATTVALVALLACSAGSDDAARGAGGAAGRAAAAGTDTSGGDGGLSAAGQGGRAGRSAGSAGKQAGGAPNQGNGGRGAAAVGGTGGDSSGAGNAGGQDLGGSAGEANAGPCPTTPPAADATCSGMLACSYGTHPLAACRTRAVCDAGRFVVTEPPAHCTSVADECPAAPPSGACDEDGLSCLFDSGELCDCRPCCNNGCPRSCGDAATGTLTWLCQSPPPEADAGCPMLTPNDGTACDVPPELRCPPATCGYSVACEMGVWRWTWDCPPGG